MPFVIVVLTLLAALTASDADAETDDDRSVADSDTLVAQNLDESFPAGLQTLVMDGDTLMVHQVEPVDSSAVQKQGSSFLKGSLRIVAKVASGTIVGIVFSPFWSRVLGARSVEGDSGLGTAIGAYIGFGLGYPIGVYLVDARESSFWLTLIGGGLGWWGLLPC